MQTSTAVKSRSGFVGPCHVSPMLRGVSIHLKDKNLQMPNKIYLPLQTCESGGWRNRHSDEQPLCQQCGSCPVEQSKCWSCVRPPPPPPSKTCLTKPISLPAHRRVSITTKSCKSQVELRILKAKSKTSSNEGTADQRPPECKDNPSKATSWKLQVLTADHKTTDRACPNLANHLHRSHWTWWNPSKYTGGVSWHLSLWKVRWAVQSGQLLPSLPYQSSIKGHWTQHWHKWAGPAQQ